MKIPKDMQKGAIHKTNNYGLLEVVGYRSAKDIDVRFINTGFTSTCQSVHAREGRVKDLTVPDVCGVGFTGVGKYKQVNDRQAYCVWSGMLYRCYSENRSARNASYSDCSVVKEWHNFQSFAEWFYRHHKDGLHLDKDKRVCGNRVYGPDFCCFITPKENTEISQSRKFKVRSPAGLVVDVFNLNKFCRDNNLTRGNLQMVLRGVRPHHKGWTRI